MTAARFNPLPLFTVGQLVVSLDPEDADVAPARVLRVSHADGACYVDWAHGACWTRQRDLDVPMPEAAPAPLFAIGASVIAPDGFEYESGMGKVLSRFYTGGHWVYRVRWAASTHYAPQHALRLA